MDTKQMFEKMQADRDICEMAFNRMNECYNKMHPKVIYERLNNMTFYVPEYFLKYLHGYFHLISNVNPDLTSDSKLKMFGVEILIGYENKIVLAHKDAPINSEYKSEVQL